VSKRFREIVERATARAEQEQRETFERLRAMPMPRGWRHLAIGRRAPSR
jgi:hypothetical protein